MRNLLLAMGSIIFFLSCKREYCGCDCDGLFGDATGTTIMHQVDQFPLEECTEDESSAEQMCNEMFEARQEFDILFLVSGGCVPWE